MTYPIFDIKNLGADFDFQEEMVKAIVFFKGQEYTIDLHSEEDAPTVAPSNDIIEDLYCTHLLFLEGVPSWDIPENKEEIQYIQKILQEMENNENHPYYDKATRELWAKTNVI